VYVQLSNRHLRCRVDQSALGGGPVRAREVAGRVALGGAQAEHYSINADPVVSLALAGPSAKWTPQGRENWLKSAGAASAFRAPPRPVTNPLPPLVKPPSTA
jgi:hypothetical protein